MSDKPLTIITGGNVSTDNIQTKRLSTDEAIIGGQKITGVTHDRTSNNPEEIPSSYLLDKIQHEYSEDVKKFQKTLDQQVFIPVISDDLIPPYFSYDSKWTNTNFSYQQGTAVYRNNKDDIVNPQAELYIKQQIFTAPGTYFFIVDILSIQSGRIEVRDGEGEVLLTCRTDGKHMFSIEVTEPDLFTVSVHVLDVQPNDRVILNRLHVHLVQQRARDYFKFIGDDILSGGAGSMASVQYVDSLVNTLRNEFNTVIRNTIAAFDGIIQAHVGERNPHKTNYTDTGSAPADHSHTPESLGASPKDHKHNPADIGAALKDHSHTADSVGAAKKDHTHELSNLGAAGSAHNHDIKDLINSSILLGHVDKTHDNVHGVNKGHVDLDEVNNYGVATLTDFKTKVHDKYTTPAGVANFIADLVSDDPALKYIPLAPKILVSSKYTIHKDEEVTFTLKSGGLYEMLISCTDLLGADVLGMYFKTSVFDPSNNNYVNTYEYGTNIDNVKGTSWESEVTNMAYFTQGKGYNRIVGRALVDTNEFSISGSYHTWKGTQVDNVVEYSPDDVYPITTKCTVADPSFMIGYDDVLLTIRNNGSRVISPQSESAIITVTIFEYVNATQFANVIDNVPLFSRAELLGTIAPHGWSIENGETLNIADGYVETKDFILARNLNVTDEVYAADIVATGECKFFVVNSTTIKVPTRTASDGSIRIIKTKMR